MTTQLGAGLIPIANVEGFWKVGGRYCVIDFIQNRLALVCGPRLGRTVAISSYFSLEGCRG